MMLELSVSKFSEETFAKMTGLPFVTTDQRQQLEKIYQASRMAGQPLDPKTQQALQSPVWGQVLDVLRNDLQRAYRIDVETNSTVEPEAVEDQKNISDLMLALGQYLNGVGPLVQNGVMPLEAAKSMMLAISRRFRFGEEIEDQISTMQPPKVEDESKKELVVAQQKIMDVTNRLAEKDLAVKGMELRVDRLIAMADLSGKQTDIALKEIKVQTLEDRLNYLESMLQEKFQNFDKAQKLKQSTGDQIRTLQSQNVKDRMDYAQSVDKSVSDGMQTMQAVVQQLAQMQSEMLTAITQQSAQTNESINKLAIIVASPRRNRAIRGKDGRISETVSEVIQ